MVILRRVLVRSYIGRYIGPYHRRIPFSLTKSARLLIAYTRDCRLNAGAQIFGNTVVQGLPQGDVDPGDVEAIAKKIAARFPHGNISFAVDHIAAQAAIGRLCITTLQSLDVADWRDSYAALLRRVFADGLGMYLGQTNAELGQAAEVLIEMESLRYVDPATFDNWDSQRRRFLAGLIVGDAMAADFLGQQRAGVKKPKPNAETNTLFGNYIMFDPADTSTKGTTLPLRVQPGGPGMTPSLPQ